MRLLLWQLAHKPLGFVNEAVKDRLVSVYLSLCLCGNL